MRSKLLFLMLMLAAVLPAGSVQASMLANSGFEEGTWTSEDDMPDDWWKWGDGDTRWMSGDTDEGTAHSGDKFILLDGTAWSTEVGQYMMTEVTAGKDYYWGVFHKDSSTVAGGGDPPESAGQYDLHIRWYSEAPTSTTDSGGRTELPRDEYYDVIDLDESGNVYPPNSSTTHANSGEYETAPAEWTRFVVGPFTAPAGATHVAPVVLNWYADWTTWATGAGVLLDDMYFGPYPYPDKPVYGPDPADEAQGVPPDPIPNTPAGTTTLSWHKDYFDGRGPKVELWWGKQDDPNFWYVEDEAIKIMDLADVNSFDLGDAIGGPIYLQPDGVYYWVLKYEDPNDGGWGIAELAVGDTWSFDTINRPPVVDAGLHYDRWQNAGADAISIVLDASYTDDGLPVGGNITYTWSETLSGGATTPTYNPPGGRNVEDPNITFPVAGNYLLKLIIHDDQGGDQDEPGEGTVLIRIFANDEDRLRAHYPLDTNANDSDILPGGDTHNGTLHDNPVWGVGQVAGAIELDGTDDVGADGFGDFISIDDTGSDPNFQADTWENSDLIDGMTVYAWMKLDADGWSKSWESIVAKSTDSWELLRDGGNADVGFAIKGGVGYANSSGTDVTSGWHQVAGVYTRSKVIFYVDGLVTSSADAGTLDLEASTNFNRLGQPINDQDWQVPKSAGKILIGNTNNPSVHPTNDFTFGGLIDQVRIFDAAVPKWADEAGTPGIVELYRTDGGHASCNGYMEADVNQDCYITLADFALVAKDWLQCNDEANADCD